MILFYNRTFSKYLLHNISNILLSFAIFFVSLQTKQIIKYMLKHFKVIHLELKEDHTHHYFGSLKALCDNYGKDKIGIGYPYIRAVGLSDSKFYENNKCIIRQGILITTPRKMVKPISNENPKKNV